MERYRQTKEGRSMETSATPTLSHLKNYHNSNANKIGDLELQDFEFPNESNILTAKAAKNISISEEKALGRRTKKIRKKLDTIS